MKFHAFLAISALAVSAAMPGTAHASLASDAGCQNWNVYNELADGQTPMVDPCQSFYDACYAAGGYPVEESLSGVVNYTCVYACGPNQHYVTNPNGGGSCVDNPTYPGGGGGGGHGPTCDPYNIPDPNQPGAFITCTCTNPNPACSAGPGRSIPGGGGFGGFPFP